MRLPASAWPGGDLADGQYYLVAVPDPRSPTGTSLQDWLDYQSLYCHEVLTFSEDEDEDEDEDDNDKAYKSSRNDQMRTVIGTLNTC